MQGSPSLWLTPWFCTASGGLCVGRTSAYSWQLLQVSVALALGCVQKGDKVLDTTSQFEAFWLKIPDFPAD
jgi:hypothetical protein